MFFLEGFSAKQQKTLKKKKSSQRYRALRDNYMENDRQDESLTGQVRDQAEHCPLTGRYFQPCKWVSVKQGLTVYVKVLVFISLRIY